MVSCHAQLGRWLVAAASVLAVVGCDPDDGFDLGATTLTATARWDCCPTTGEAGFAMRVYLSLPGADRGAGPADCPMVPVDLEVSVNGVQAALLDRGGAELGGDSGTQFVRCHAEAFAEAGPFPRFDGDQALVRVGRRGKMAEAVFERITPGSAAGPEVWAMPSPSGQARVGQDLLLGFSGELFSRKPVMAELYFSDQESPHSQGTWATLLPDGLHVPAVGRPGKAALLIRFESQPLEPRGGARVVPTVRCEGLLACVGHDSNSFGPLPIEILP